VHVVFSLSHPQRRLCSAGAGMSRGASSTSSSLLARSFAPPEWRPTQDDVNHGGAENTK
jgi:hypothetical protein